MFEGAKDLSRFIVARLKEAGSQAFLVGGCVRDLQLGFEPKDYDVATSAAPAELLRLFPKAIQVGSQFGVLLIREGTAQVEVATFRSDHEYLDGRRPASVTFEQDPRQDVLRRDFTINALLMDPETGELTDYVGAQADLTAGVIRAIGDPATRFREDHLRLLRAVRFAARFGFTIDSATYDAIRGQSRSIRLVSAERVRDEVTRMLTSQHPRRAFELLRDTGLLTEILPEVHAMAGIEQPAEFHPEGDVWTHTMLMLDGLERPSLTLALGVLLHDVGKPVTFERAPDRIRFNGHVEAGVTIAREILRRLRYPKAESERVLALIANHMRFKDVPKMKDSTVKRFLRQPHFHEHLALHRLDCVSSHGKLDNYEAVRERLRVMPREVLRPTPLIGGDQLIREGYTPGPDFKRVLQAVEEAQLNGEIETEAEAMLLAHQLLGSAP